MEAGLKIFGPLLLTVAAMGRVPPPPPRPPVPPRGSVPVHISGGERALVSDSIPSPSRRACDAVIVLAADNIHVDEQILTALEGHFLARGLRVVSSALTGRVVSGATTRGQIEGAAKLPTLERALVLAKGANADCVFYLLGLEIGTKELIRYFVWRNPTPELIEVDHAAFDAVPDHRRWFAGGPLWRIDGKVIDVATGDILSIISLKHSTPYAVDRRLQVAFDGTSLVPHGDYYGWRFVSAADIGVLRNIIMSRLAIEVRGDH